MKSVARAADGNLGRFQDRFADALFAAGPGAVLAADVAPLAAQPGFAVYRNTVMKGCIDALQANYPAVSRMVGDEWFRAAADRFVRDNRPRHASLLDYGSNFADFLAGFEPARELPYLAPVARLDRHWTEAHVAADEAPLAAAAVANLSRAQLACSILTPHAAARWAWHPEHPILTIWERNREPAPVGNAPSSDLPDIDWHAEGALITRPSDSVEWISIAASGCAFLDACARGCTLADAASAALAVDGDADLSRLMAQLLRAGAFSTLVTRDAATDEETR